MKIENNFNPYINSNIQPEKLKKNSNVKEEKNIDYYNTPNPAECLGRSQVTVQRKSLSEADKGFIDVLSQTLNLSKKEKQSFNQLIVDYFKDNKVTSFNELSGEEHLEDIAVITEAAVQILELSPTEEMTLMDELIKKTIYQDEYTPKVDVYQKDFDLLLDVCNKYEIEPQDCHAIYDIMSEYAELSKDDSLFSALKKEKNEYISYCVSDIKKVTGFDDEKLEDFILDLVQKGQIDNSVRKKVGLNNTSNAIFYRGLAEKVIAKNITQNFNLSLNNEKYITELLSERTDKNDEKENMKTAFIIANKFDLDSNAENYILETIKDIQNKDYSYFDRMIIEELTNQT